MRYQQACYFNNFDFHMCFLLVFLLFNFHCIILSIKYKLILTQNCAHVWIERLKCIALMSRFRHRKSWITTCGLSTGAGNPLTFFFAVCNNRPVRVIGRAGNRPEITVAVGKNCCCFIHLKIVCWWFLFSTKVIFKQLHSCLKITLRNWQYILLLCTRWISVEHVKQAEKVNC